MPGWLDCPLSRSLGWLDFKEVSGSQAAASQSLQTNWNVCHVLGLPGHSSLLDLFSEMLGAMQRLPLSRKACTVPATGDPQGEARRAANPFPGEHFTSTTPPTNPPLSVFFLRTGIFAVIPTQAF